MLLRLKPLFTLQIRGTLAYGTSKAAVDHLSRNMALELGPQGVRVNCVNPGVIVTEFQRRAGMPQAGYEKVSALNVCDGLNSIFQNTRSSSYDIGVI